MNIGARLQSLGVSCLIVDKNERVGDNWRNRYRVSDIERTRSMLWREILIYRDVDTCYARSGRIHTHGLSAFPAELATVYTERQAG